MNGDDERDYVEEAANRAEYEREAAEEADPAPTPGILGTGIDRAARRELWLGVALCVARDGLPAPKRLSIDTAVDLTFDDASAAAQWAAALQLDHADIIDDPPHRLIHSCWGQRGGVIWNVTAYVGRAEPTAPAGSLADQVVDAIVTVPPDH